jgi:hypothetical protein
MRALLLPMGRSGGTDFAPLTPCQTTPTEGINRRPVKANANLVGLGLQRKCQTVLKSSKPSGIIRNSTSRRMNPRSARMARAANRGGKPGDETPKSEKGRHYTTTSPFVALEGRHVHQSADGW